MKIPKLPIEYESRDAWQGIIHSSTFSRAFSIFPSIMSGALGLSVFFMASPDTIIISDGLCSSTD